MALNLLEKSDNTSQERVQSTLWNDTLKKTISSFNRRFRGQIKPIFYNF